MYSQNVRWFLSYDFWISVCTIRQIHSICLQTEPHFIHRFYTSTFPKFPATLHRSFEKCVRNPRVRSNSSFHRDSVHRDVSSKSPVSSAVRVHPTLDGCLVHRVRRRSCFLSFVLTPSYGFGHSFSRLLGLVRISRAILHACFAAKSKELCCLVLNRSSPCRK